MVYEYGNEVRSHFLFSDICLINHPDGVGAKHVLQENQRNYSKGIFLLCFLLTLCALMRWCR